MRVDIHSRNFFGLKCKVPFITARFQRNLDCTKACAGRVIWCTWVTLLQCQGRYGRKIVSALELSPLHYPPTWTLLALLVAHAQWVSCGVFESPECSWKWNRDENRFGVYSTLPFIMTDISLTCTVPNACTGNAIWNISVTPLQRKGRYGQKTVSASRLKFPSLLTDLHCLCSMRREWDVAYFLHRAAMGGEMPMKNCFGLKSKVLINKVYCPKAYLVGSK
jgi:hypothetical protein